MTFLREMMLISQANQNSAIFVPIGIFYRKFQSKVCHRCHDLVMMSMNISDIAILNIKGFVYCCIISRISKNVAINLMQNTDLIKKSRTL